MTKGKGEGLNIHLSDFIKRIELLPRIFFSSMFLKFFNIFPTLPVPRAHGANEKLRPGLKQMFSFVRNIF